MSLLFRCQMRPTKRTLTQQTAIQDMQRLWRKLELCAIKKLLVPHLEAKLNFLKFSSPAQVSLLFQCQMRPTKRSLTQQTAIQDMQRLSRKLELCVIKKLLAPLEAKLNSLHDALPI